MDKLELAAKAIWAQTRGDIPWETAHPEMKARRYEIAKAVLDAIRDPTVGTTSDGVSLTSTTHPRAPWWKSIWLRLFHRDIQESSLELVTVETIARDTPLHRLNNERYFGIILNAATKPNGVKWSDDYDFTDWSPSSQAGGMLIPDEKK